MANTHLDRKELKRPDAFQEKAGDFLTFINENAKLVIATVGVLLAIGIGFAIYNNHRSHVSAQADSALFQARKSLETTLQKKAPEPGKPAPIVSASGDWEKDSRAGIDQLEKVVKTYPGTRAAFEASLLLGDTYSDHKNSAKAAEYYKNAVSNAPNRALKAAGQHSLSYSYEDLKQYDAAIDAMRQVIANGDKALKADALMSLARNYELKGDKVKALEQYNQVAKDYPNTPISRTAELQKTRLH